MYLNNIQAIVSDFDGTIIDSNQKISKKVSASIKNLTHHGYTFSIATGRAYEGLVESMSRQLGLTQLHIVRGGSEIISGQTNQVVWGKYIPQRYVEKLLDELIKYKSLIILAESGKHLFTRDGKGDTEFATGAQIKTFDDLPTNNVPKIAIPPLYDQQIINPIFQQLADNYNTLHIVKTTSAKGMGIDINDGSAGKHQALLAYANLMKFHPKSILGIGDSYNDYPLLTACGIKVAMGQAPQELKAIADYIVGNVAEDGLSEIIEKVLAHHPPK